MLCAASYSGGSDEDKEDGLASISIRPQKLPAILRDVLQERREKVGFAGLPIPSFSS